MNEKLAQAMDHIRDDYITEAASAKRKRRKLWIGALAAILVLALLFNGPGIPLSVYAETISQASGSRTPERPDPDDYATHEEFQAAWQSWSSQRDRTEDQADAALEDLTPFFLESTERYLSGSGEENRVWSPVNAYIALAMLSEITATAMTFLTVDLGFKVASRLSALRSAQSLPQLEQLPLQELIRNSLLFYDLRLL